MPIIHLPPASIECKVADLKFRKFIPQLPTKDEKFTLIYRFVLDYNSQAIIATELDPKTALYDTASMLNKDDGINGEQIEVKSRKNIPESSADLSKGSGRHKASFVTARGFIYAKLTKPVVKI
jgi:hypothetical protein